MWSAETLQLIDLARDEDLGPGDLTSALLPDAGGNVRANIVPRQPGVICGLDLAPAVCASFSQRLAGPLTCRPTTSGDRLVAEGDDAVPGIPVATLSGSQSAVLAVERTLLNFLGRMSGVATLTRRYVHAARAASPLVQILDTRKTIPGWRELDKYAVRAGGGHNHRRGLYDAVLVKDNHLAGIPLDGLARHVASLIARLPLPRPALVEIEVDSLDQLAEICRVPGVDVVLLDNFTPDQMRAAVELRDRLGLKPRLPPAPGSPPRHAAQSRTPAAEAAPPRSLSLEASGGINLDKVAVVAATGVDRISIGALTHSAVSLDLGLDR